MPRPRKCRRVCEYPRTLVFAPAGGRKKETVNMTVDEYETIRLIDGEGYSQEQCGKQMEISRTAVQLDSLHRRRGLPALSGRRGLRGLRRMLQIRHQPEI